jgi:cell division cycle protein 37
MVAGGQSAQSIFRTDVEDTYQHIINRVESQKLKKKQRPVPPESRSNFTENPDTVISFNVPDGPPPENLVLEGPGTESMDVEDVRKALQMRWDLFCGLPEDLQESLKTGDLTAVNKVLGNMSVSDAENAVKALDMEGIRDETGRANRADEDGDDDDDDDEPLV